MSKRATYDHTAQDQAHSDLARGLCNGEVDLLTPAELDLLNQALQTAAIAAGTAKSIMDAARVRFKGPARERGPSCGLLHRGPCGQGECPDAPHGGHP